MVSRTRERALSKLTIRSCQLGNEGCVVLAEALRGNGALPHLRRRAQARVLQLIGIYIP